MELETKGKVCNFLLGSLRTMQTSIPPFLLNLDYLKDIITYLIFRETIMRIEGHCDITRFECLAASEAEKAIVTALLVTVCVSVTLTSMDSFFMRKKFFKTNFLLDLIFAILSPVLPALYHFRLSQMIHKLDKHKSEFKVNKDNLKRKAIFIEKLTNSIQLTKEMEVGFEAILQIFLLLGLTCFIHYVYQAPSGQTYSYFFGVAGIVLKGNKIFVYGSLTLSFLVPCWFHVNRTNFLQHGSLNMSRKLILMARNVLFLFVRVLAIISAIFIPVIKNWSMFIENQGIDGSFALDNWRFHLEFQKHFIKGLDTVTGEIRTNMIFFCLFLFIHFILVASYGIFCSTKFSKGSIKEQAIYLISTFSLPLPFLTINGIDRGEDKAELRFLVVLHSLENFIIVLASSLFYIQESCPRLFLMIDCVLVTANILAVLVSVLYVTKLKLFAGLPQDIPSSLPSYGLEVSFQFELISF